MEYIMLYHDFLETTQALTDAERGRLIVAMVEFARDGRADESALVGNERVLFPVFRRQIERDARAYEARVQANSRNGKKGGRPKKPGKTQNNPSVSAESEKSQEKEKDKEKEEYKDKEKEKDKNKIKIKNRIKKKNRGEGAPKRPTPQPWTRFWIFVGRTGCL